MTELAKATTGAPPLNEAFLQLEYEQLCESIRDCWKYIAELIKNFIFVQIILIGAVGLGSQVASRSIENLARAAVAPPTQTSGESATQPESPKEGEPTAAANIPAEQNPQAAEGRSLNFWKALLAFAGCIVSLGAWVQNGRLYYNAKIFIARGEFLESRSGFITGSEGESGAISINRYMHSRLNGLGAFRDKKPWETIKGLSLAYFVTGVIWMIALVTNLFGGWKVPSSVLPF